MSKFFMVTREKGIRVKNNWNPENNWTKIKSHKTGEIFSSTTLKDRSPQNTNDTPIQCGYKKNIYYCII